ncbi:hypothetical protein HGG82_12440 [Marinomonas sp. M1K-6]|uniref:Uncharacterized protein n=1 Tax=Marinomonas profundi TaxID=2726122 RepID=A0A847R7G1_9GAMM|nr:hypothetical protein [Marinomonas profundi]NLQ18423.1 hypothetical protein [Marinomonas profundi]UDV02477.1 hypothetical protein J8N69_12895 [Marinomonas profundi]
MNRRVHLHGGLLVELLLVCALIAMFLPFLVTALSRLQERHLLAETYQQQQALNAAIEAHFQAQWSRLVPANCRPNDALFLTIQSGASPPDRLASRSVAADSDWLQGRDYGLCRRAIEVSENPFESTLACHWKAGDRVTFSSCESYYQGEVLSVSTHKSVIQLAGDGTADGAIGQSGMLESQDGFYWYVSKGKDGLNAFWRTPEESGNSLELWNGIERLSVFPLLDNNQDGLVDTLDTRYGDIRLTHLRGLWVEYQYRLSDCLAIDDQWQTQEYTSMRGDSWQYASPCQGVGNQIIVLKGR